MFVLAYDNTASIDQVSIDSYQKYFLPRVKLLQHQNWWKQKFYDLPINDSVKQYDEIRKISTAERDDYTTGCLLDFAYLEKKYRLIAVDLSKQKALDADSRRIQQIILTGKIKVEAANTRVIIYYILEKSIETKLEFSKRMAKVL